MAERYWVGGTASWDTTAGTKWALTSGGTGGQAVPTATDNVYFDANSGTVTVTVAASASCLNLNCTGFTGTLTGSSPLAISGDFTLVTGMTYSVTGTITFSGSTLQTITSAGKTLAAINCGSLIASSVILADTLNLSGSLAVVFGTFDTNGNTINGSAILCATTQIRTIYLRSSIVNLSNQTPFSVTSFTGLTFNAGTSQINVSASNVPVNFIGNEYTAITFYNLTFTGVGSIGIGQTYARTFSGSFNFNNLTLANTSSAGSLVYVFGGNITINGTLTAMGAAGNKRIFIQTSVKDVNRQLTLNSTPSLTDVDFRDICVKGTAAPISGTRLGDMRGNSGITFNTSKNCYRIGSVTASNWSDNQWSATSGGSVSTDYFPLPQDNAIIDNSTGSGTITLDAAIPYIGTLDSSSRTTALTFAGTTAYSFYGDIKTGSGITYSFTGGITLGGRNTQTIVSNGKSIASTVTIDSIDGVVQLGDAFSAPIKNIVINNGTFKTNNYNISASIFNINGTNNPRTILFGSSTITLGSSLPWPGGPTNLTYDVGTSQINFTAATVGLNGLSFNYNNVALTNTSLTAFTLNSTTLQSFNTLSLPVITSGVCLVNLYGDLTIGTLISPVTSPITRYYFKSIIPGAQKTLTIGTWSSASDIDFRDIRVMGAVGTLTGTRLGNCGGNSGITFDTPKTVYWNLAGAQNWSATGWALTSGGTPAINNFPLAQDTAVFDNSGSVTGIITINFVYNISTLNTLSRTTAMTLSCADGLNLFGSLLLGTGVTTASTGRITIGGLGTNVITSNGSTIAWAITIDCVTGTVQLSDAITLNNSADSTGALALSSGTFDANGFNVTSYKFNSVGNSLKTLKMGSGLWTITGSGTCFNIISTVTLYKGTANILLSDNTITARQFTGFGLTYNKLTIGGNTSTSTTTITGNNQFSELASTKTVAHTIAMSGTQTIGTWSVTGTAGNVVTLSTAFTLNLIGGRSSGIDYLTCTSVTATSSLGEFYVGANSTNVSGNTGVIFTAAPTPVTRYWVGGTGTWDATTTTNWSATSGGTGGASVPTSVDSVVFDSASSATSYTVTCTATLLRCANLTFAAPASGVVTWAGTAPIAIHNSLTLPATGLTRTFTGALNYTGTGSGKTITTNGVALQSAMNINSFNGSWSLGSSASTSMICTVTNGTFLTNSYNFTPAGISSSCSNDRTINLSSSTLSCANNIVIDFTIPINLNFIAGISIINATPYNPSFYGGNQTFYNISCTNTVITSVAFTGTNSFNDLSFTPRSSGVGLTIFTFYANQTITGTLTCSASSPTRRLFLKSDIAGVQRTLTVNAWTTPTDCDVQDILVAGAVAPLSTTRFGDCKGNSGITFPASKNCYRKGVGSWESNQWAATSTGTPDVNYFPLAQDIAYITNDTTAGTITFSDYNYGSLICTNTTTVVNINPGTTPTTWYGDITFSSGVTPNFNFVGNTFSGRNTQTIISAGKTCNIKLIVDSLGGTVVFADAINLGASSIILNNGTLSTNYNVNTDAFVSTVSTARVLNMGSGTWSLGGIPVWNILATNLTVNAGTSTIDLTNTTTTTKTFIGAGLTYNNLNIGGPTSTSTLLLLGNNTFNTISSTKTVAHTITLVGGSVNKVANWTVSGTVGNVVTINSQTAGTRANLIKIGGGTVSADYLSITDCYVSPTNTWYSGNNSTFISNMIGWIFSSLTPVIVPNITNFLFFF